jgi:hypothetical protein
MKTALVKKIISGGQTGADRAALDFAMAHHIPHGGWCPAGRTAEDGVIDWRYRLKETPSPTYVQRTEWNIRDSDGTVVFSIHQELFGGSKLTCEFATRYRKPCLHLSRQRDGATSAKKLREFVEQHKIQSLNVAGPRISTEPEIAEFTKSVLKALLVDENI